MNETLDNIISLDWGAACPRCLRPLGRLTDYRERLVCLDCGSYYMTCDDIWRFLPPERAAHFRAFLRDYTAVRYAEGRGSDDPEYYRRLPATPPDDPLAWQWGIRAKSFAALQSHVLSRPGRALKALDLGAGVGWLSYRLARLGHSPCSIDLTDDPRDGLAAARHYAEKWPRIQAEFDRLPIADGEADLVIYNASLHYSTDYAATLSEALRVLGPKGRIVVIDTPIYRREESGRQMVAERHNAFERDYGARSDTLPSIEYLTWDRVHDLGRRLGLHWRVIRPWYGWRWALRPWQARLKRRREPSTFALLVAQRTEKSR